MHIPLVPCRSTAPCRQLDSTQKMLVCPVNAVSLGKADLLVRRLRSLLLHPMSSLLRCFRGT